MRSRIVWLTLARVTVAAGPEGTPETGGWPLVVLLGAIAGILPALLIRPLPQATPERT